MKETTHEITDGDHGLDVSHEVWDIRTDGNHGGIERFHGIGPTYIDDFTGI